MRDKSGDGDCGRDGTDSTTVSGTCNNGVLVGVSGRTVFWVVDDRESKIGDLLTASELLSDLSMEFIGTAFTLGLRARNGTIEFASKSNSDAILA